MFHARPYLSRFRKQDLDLTILPTREDRQISVASRRPRELDSVTRLEWLALPSERSSSALNHHGEHSDPLAQPWLAHPRAKRKHERHANDRSSQRSEPSPASHRWPPL